MPGSSRGMMKSPIAPVQSKIERGGRRDSRRNAHPPQSVVPLLPLFECGLQRRRAALLLNQDEFQNLCTIGRPGFRVSHRAFVRPAGTMNENRISFGTSLASSSTSRRERSEGALNSCQAANPSNRSRDAKLALRPRNQRRRARFNPMGQGTGRGSGEPSLCCRPMRSAL